MRGLGSEAVAWMDVAYAQMMRVMLLNDRVGVQRLLVSGYPINMVDDTGRTMLHMAAFHGREKVVDPMIQFGANIDVLSGEGETPVQIALRTKQSTTWRMMNVAFARYGANQQKLREEKVSVLISDQ